MEALYDRYLASNGVCIDTRKLRAGELFFALKGDNFDGNNFANKALDAGAAAIVVDDLVFAEKDDERIVLVQNVQDTLVELAKHHRSKLQIPIIGITGSNGKTTTKELLHQVLSKKYNCFATKGNFNNHIGVPLTLLDINHAVEIAIVEMGANHQGEIDYLSNIAAPTHGLITNIGKAHLEGFGGIEGVKKGKSELYRYLAAHEGTIFINKGDQTLLSLLPPHSKSVAYDQGDILVVTAFPYLDIRIDDQKVISRLTGAYNVQNIAAAVAIGKYFSVDSAAITDAISSYDPTNNRSQIRTVGSNTYILDCYNANPSSMLLSIKNLALRNSDKPAVLIIGDMLEVGPEEKKEHQNILDKVGEYDWKAVYTVGPRFQAVDDNPYKMFDTYLELNNYLELYPIRESIVLLKASRSVQLDKITLH